jgi:hypothetical protein
MMSSISNNSANFRTLLLSLILDLFNLILLDVVILLDMYFFCIFFLQQARSRAFCEVSHKKVMQQLMLLYVMPFHTKLSGKLPELCSDHCFFCMLKFGE